ncbi:MAG: hypothetical protein HQL56_06905 [Magnetococcales bacterium]|nr:hypothetical protein [Magnetococcales bacterium]
MAHETKFFSLDGGLDRISPAIRTPAGNLIEVENYLPIQRGYQRIPGFERCDGRPAPSKASYWVLRFDAATAAIAQGDIVAGGTSAATAEALIGAVVASGSYGGGDAAGYLVLFNLNGTFQDNEALRVSGVTKCFADGVAANRGADNDSDNTTWLRAAIEATRSDIGSLSGSGPIRGVWVYNGIRYAFRDNAGATAGQMFKSTTSGWASVSLGYTLDFTLGSAAFAEGQTVTGGTSGATATVKRVIVTSGAWGTADAAGYLVVHSPSGTFQAAETITSASGSAKASGAQAAITLPPGGRYDFVNHNFYGSSDRFRLYGCNGVGTAFEWDGTTFTPIRTGMTTDQPNHIAVHRNHLFLAFPGGSLQFSSLGEPCQWSVLTGAGEIGIGEEITGFIPDYAGSLIVYGRNKVCQLSGTGADDFVLAVITSDSGAVEWTAQKIAQPLHLDDLGVRRLSTTAAFGDFGMGGVSDMVQPWLDAKRKAGVTATGSMRVRSQNHYRLFFSDGSGLAIYLGGKVPRCGLFNLGKVVRCACSGEDASGNEVLLFGSDDGFVYEMEAGTSFDGSEVSAFARLAFNHMGSPSFNKRFHKAVLEVDAASGTRLGMTAEYAYGDSGISGTLREFDVRGGGGFWSEANWDAFLWSSPTEGTAVCELRGSGNNISITVVSQATYEDPHIFHGITFTYSRRGLR